MRERENKHTNDTPSDWAVLCIIFSVRRTLDGSLTEAEVRSGVSEVKLAYLGESDEGDVLQVRLWCPGSGERTVVCSMTKGEETPVCQVTLTFNKADL